MVSRRRGLIISGMSNSPQQTIETEHRRDIVGQISQAKLTLSSYFGVLMV